MLIEAEVRLLLVEAIRPQLHEERLGIVNFDEAPFLARVAAVFGETDAKSVPREDRTRHRFIASLDDLETEDLLIERQCLRQAAYGKVEFVVRVRRHS